MQLGATKVPASQARASMVDEVVAEASGRSHTAPGGWDDNSDLIDVAADAGDWSESFRFFMCPRNTDDFP